MPFNETLYQELKPGQPIVVPKEEFAKRFFPLTAKEQKELDLGNRPKRKEAKEQGKVSYQEARDILGSDCLGPEAIEKLLGTKKDLPPIPFSRQELERAKELNQFLVLRINGVEKSPGIYVPLTMLELYDQLETKFEGAGKGKVLYDTKDPWKTQSDFFTKDTPRASWALVSKEPIPNSKSKNYLQQTEIIIEYLVSSVFKDMPLPQVYKEAIDEFNTKKQAITEEITAGHWQNAAKVLEELAINQLTRQAPVEALYDGVIYLENNNQRLLESSYTWTSRRSSDGYLVRFGHAAARGASLGRWTPVRTLGPLGVVLSRSL